MSFQTDMSEVKEVGSMVPPGEYALRVLVAEEGVTANGDNKVTVDYEVYEGEWKGTPVKFHTVVFFRDPKSKGAGFAKMVLKALGEPNEGAITVNSKNWIGKVLTATIEHETNPKDGKSYARVKFTKPYLKDYTQKTDIGDGGEAVPF